MKLMVMLSNLMSVLMSVEVVFLLMCCLFFLFVGIVMKVVVIGLKSLMKSARAFFDIDLFDLFVELFVVGLCLFVFCLYVVCKI